MGERLWYYSENEQQEGPIAEGKLRQMISSQIVNSNALVWTDGMQNWVPASQAFQDLIPARATVAPPPVPRQGQQNSHQQQHQMHHQQNYQDAQTHPQQQYQQQQYQQQQYQQQQPSNQTQQHAGSAQAPNQTFDSGMAGRPHSGGSNGDAKPAPWRRLFARSCDTVVYNLITITPLTLLFNAVPSMNITSGPGYHIQIFLFQLYTFAAWMPIEAALFSTFGTTPFKALFNVHVHEASGAKIPFANSISRSLELALKSGNWILLLPVSLLADYPQIYTPVLLALGLLMFCLLGWQSGLYVKNGSSDWDRNKGRIMTCPTNSVMRNILMIIVVFAITGLQYFITSILPPAKSIRPPVQAPETSK